MVLVSLVSVLYLLYFYISTFWSMCAVPNMAVFCSSLTSWFADMLLTYFLKDFEIVLLLLLLLFVVAVFRMSVWHCCINQNKGDVDTLCRYIRHSVNYLNFLVLQSCALPAAHYLSASADFPYSFIFLPRDRTNSTSIEHVVTSLVLHCNSFFCLQLGLSAHMREYSWTYVLCSTLGVWIKHFFSLICPASDIGNRLAYFFDV